MARYTGPVCRLCRREGMKLFLKGETCLRSAPSNGAALRPACTSSGGARCPTSRCSYGEKQSSVVSTACSSAR